MHILETETEEQAVYFRHLVHPSYSILPPSHKKLNKWIQGSSVAGAGPGLSWMPLEAKGHHTLSLFLTLVGTW